MGGVEMESGKREMQTLFPNRLILCSLWKFLILLLRNYLWVGEEAEPKESKE